MSVKHKIQSLVAAFFVAVASLGALAQTASAPKSAVQKAFSSPEAASKALADAIRARDVQALLAVVGPASKSWLFSGDAVADRADWAKFLAAYDKKNKIVKESDTQAVLVVGDDNWPFPAPLKKKGDSWAFDAAAGREEIINRRIGHNELDTMQTLLAIVDAQRQYAAADPNHNGFDAYARRFISSPGKKDGLYWPTPPGAAPSPLGPLVGEATREGYRLKAGQTRPQPYHGYYYRMLAAQGKDAHGGAFNYLVNGRLIGGFAVVAYPAKYGVSGVMTFIVNYEGTVYEKDLGNSTRDKAENMTGFNPDKTWKQSQIANVAR
ncbi:MAG TPA: DUF2950 domain-containing protein [Candidatus Methylomirabilis sp.]|nr:DUF2950 domain-containing protein [Candidatus Methylomirabilis sp.]